MKISSPIAAAFLFLASGSAVRAGALPVDVSYTITGQPGAWLLDFTLSNNISDPSSAGVWPVNYFGVDLPNATIVGNPTPPGCIYSNVFICGTDFIWLPWNYFDYSSGPSPFPAYNDLWNNIGPVYYFATHIGGPYPFPGSSLSGFQVLDTDVNAPASVAWVAQAYNYFDPYGDLYTSGGNLNPEEPAEFPVFEGTATAPAATPEPATFGSMALTFVGLLIWRRKRGASRSCAVNARM